MPNTTLRVLSSILLLCVTVVVILGAYTRLADAGLGCPDWPTCYGHIWVPDSHAEISTANEKFSDTPVEQDKTWPEQIHRIFASSLGLLILLCFFLINAHEVTLNNRRPFNSVCGLLIALVGLTGLLIVFNIIQHSATVYLEAFIAAVLLVYFGNLVRLKWRAPSTISSHFLLISLLAGLVVLQGLFGMWTVTLKLWPKVVTAHLLGGFTVLSVIALFWKSMNAPEAKTFKVNQALRALSFVVLFAVIAQIALGGWVSSNYAALACPDFPLCQNEVLPEADFQAGFNVFQKIGPNYLGGKLDNTARIAIHLSHRAGAIIVTILVLTLAMMLFLLKQTGAKPYAIALMSALALQLCLGVSNIMLALPLSVAVLHNAGGAVLLLTVIFTLSAQRAETAH